MAVPVLPLRLVEFMLVPALLRRLIGFMVVLASLRRQLAGAAQVLLRPATSAVGIGVTPEVRQKMSPSPTRSSEDKVETRPLTPSGE